MTGSEFSEVDFDLLADYVGGALDGTPEEAVVGRLVTEDPSWQEAYAELAAATGTITATLRSWGAEATPMPADVVTRLDAALLSVTAEAGTVSERRTEPGTDGSAPIRHLVAVQDDRERPSTARKRARRLRWAAPIGVAAAVLAVLGVGLQRLTNSDSQADVPTAARGLSEADGTSPQAAPQQQQSGTDYTLETLSGTAPEILVAPQGQELRSAKAAPAPAAGAMDASPLGRLRTIDALLACLNQIALENGAGPVTAQTADFARYLGAPAVIVHFTAPNGSWVWAVGPACGSPSSGSAKLASVRVG